MMVVPPWNKLTGVVLPVEMHISFALFFSGKGKVTYNITITIHYSDVGCTRGIARTVFTRKFDPETNCLTSCNVQERHCCDLLSGPSPWIRQKDKSNHNLGKEEN